MGNNYKPWHTGSAASDKTPAQAEDAIRVYKEYNENRVKVNGLLSELLKQSATGEAELGDLLLIAVEAIDRLNGDNALVDVKVLRRNLYEKYGIGDEF